MQLLKSADGDTEVRQMYVDFQLCDGFAAPTSHCSNVSSIGF